MKKSAPRAVHQRAFNTGIFCSSNLIWSHNHQYFLSCKNTVSGQNIQKRMSGKEYFFKINQIRNDTIVVICPEEIPPAAVDLTA